ncbi:MAG: peptidylprolyl isomerase [Actinobacteria bacterium]|nr:peptidylprolyl isomerase [Actinomycetota bacterium]
MAISSWLGQTQSRVAKPVVSATPAASNSAVAAARCKPVSDLQTKPRQFPSAPTSGNLRKNLRLTTNCGVIDIELDQNAPTTNKVMSNLATAAYFTKTACHRLTTSGIYVLQCGDPSGTGSGTPGFSFADENLPKADSSGTYIYPRGTLAMANSGPNTNGSQFFIVYQNSPLPANYTVWGRVTSGLSVVDRVAAAGVADGKKDGKPNANIVIEQAFAR